MAYALLVAGVLLFGMLGRSPDRRTYALIAAAGAAATLWMMR